MRFGSIYVTDTSRLVPGSITYVCNAKGAGSLMEPAFLVCGAPEVNRPGF